MSDVLIPILRDTKDPHYRYKMPKLCAKVEGSGNGIKTVITNMSAIAKSLDRPASYPTKYFGCELGAQVTMNNDYVVNGSHDAEKLLGLLYTFIKKFVLCSKCNNPETSLTVVNQTIRQKCIACGHETTIPKALHKLTTYIINHPPEGTANSVAASAGLKGKSSKSDKKSKKNGGHSPTNGHNGTNGDSGNDLNTEYNNVNGNNDDFDDFDDEDLTTDAYNERVRELCDGFHSGVRLDHKESANIFYKLVDEKKKSNELHDSNVQKELVKEAERLDIKDKATLILSELLFTENIVEEIKTYKMVLLRFCHENKKAQKYLMGGFEKLVGDVFKQQLLNTNINKILKQFYDEDILDEETLIEWSAKESKKYVSKEISKKIHELAAPFIKWLKEAEVEDDDDEEDEVVTSKNAPSQKNTNGSGKQQKSEEEEDDGIDLQFSHRVSGIQVEVKPVAPIKPVNEELVKKEDDNEEDIDIENI